MGADRLFVDTWGWLVLANDRDPAFRHVAKLRAAAARSQLWVTTDYVLDETLARMGSAAPAHMAYATEIVTGVTANQERIDEVLSSYAEGWTLSRMPAVDRNLARIAVYEMLHRDDIDDIVAISEAVALAEELSTDESPKFLNGLLGRIAEHGTA